MKMSEMAPLMGAVALPKRLKMPVRVLTKMPPPIEIKIWMMPSIIACKK